MLHHAKLDKCFWAEAAMTAIYVKNRLPSPKIEHKTPFEIVYKSKPSVEHIDIKYHHILMEGMDLGHRSLDEAEGGSTLGETGVEAGNHLRGRGKIRK
ncbi:hypothetical protein PC116_g34565 [Phytophthora cactorum]|uniref:Uncharacterized protein n=1 Tax=Phytophthora cactorum TaxID=29920 RepID=A0A8T0XX18_9STRA|nr:hypothetical protein PC113_g24284 [Phytophthora cactorum]KAG4216954.1 hypothetical protein PC116_g34565 [Phytophthora cactorum]